MPKKIKLTENVVEVLKAMKYSSVEDKLMASVFYRKEYEAVSKLPYKEREKLLERV